MARARRKQTDAYTFQLSDGTDVHVRLYEGDPDALLRVVVNRRMAVVGMWPARTDENCLEVSFGPVARQTEEEP